MNKKKLVILFGGQSSEHEVSCISAATVADNAPTEKYDLVLIGITKDGRWLKVNSVAEIRNGLWKHSAVTACILPDAILKSVMFRDGDRVSIEHVDVVFPVLHGLYGEDGCVQGLCELAQIPYVGCGVCSSAVTMDKVSTKAVLERLGISQAPYVAFRREELEEDMGGACALIAEKLSFPVFVKPSNAGSSCGITKVDSEAGLLPALCLAAAEDCKIVVEQGIAGRELECAVLGGWDAQASGVGEILAAAEFYDYDAKYNNSESRTVIGPKLPEGKTDELREMAVKIYRALDCRGLSRADFFLENGTNRIIFNEINTIPGFTSISMYPQLWAAAGIPLPGLVEKLVDAACVTSRRVVKR